MPDDDHSLDEVLGGVLAALTQARRIADEETVSVAEYYRQNPLLGGMSVPRVRVPQFEVEIPVLIEGFNDPVEGEMASPDKILGDVVDALKKAAAREGIRLPQTLAKNYERRFSERLKSIMADKAWSRKITRGEAVAREAESSFLEVHKQEDRPRFDRSQLKRVAEFIRAAAARVAIIRPAKPPEFRVTVVTSRIKDHADPITVARIRMTVREDGVEWTSVEDPDGKTRGLLIPE